MSFANNALKYGQTFMCLNYDAREHGEKVARHLANMFALIYNSKVSPELRAMIPNLSELKLDGEKSGLSKSARLAGLDQKITTRGGHEFELFSKSSSLEGDLYAAWLAKELDSPLYVESWRKGMGDSLGSECPQDKYQVNNIKRLQLVSESKTLFTWPYSKDHSKWAISETREDGVVCLADINRMASQSKRGGGAVCLKCPKCWSVFSSTIEEIEPCRLQSVASKKSKYSIMRKEFVRKVKQLLFE